MSRIDAHVASVIDRQTRTQDDSDEDEDALIAALEEENDDSSALAGFREQRLQQLHNELSRAKAQRQSGFGTYTELKDEKAVLDVTTSCKLAVVHFMKPDFARCRIMDQRLDALVAKHFDTRFVSINVENAPFLVAKLKIQVLPCVIAFKNGIAVDRLLGFEGIGVKPDAITVRELESRLLSSGVLVRSKVDAADERKRAAQRQQDEDDDDDWD